MKYVFSVEFESWQGHSRKGPQKELSASSCAQNNTNNTGELGTYHKYIEQESLGTPSYESVLE